MADALIFDLRKHDAVLACDIADEVDSSYADDLKKLRRRIRRLVPSLPTPFNVKTGESRLIGISRQSPVPFTGAAAGCFFTIHGIRRLFPRGLGLYYAVSLTSIRKG